MRSTKVSATILSQPVVATGRGGSGTRLLSMLLQEHGVFLGNRLNGSEDSIEWIGVQYESAARKLTDGAPERGCWNEALSGCAEKILQRGQWKEGQLWGWKLPETMLILPEVVQAFPNARIVHLVRHPVDTCLRSTHVTSRTDIPVGAATLHAAYSRLGWRRDPGDDDDYIRNSASWVFQVQGAIQFGRELGSSRYLEIRFEDLCADAQAVSDAIARFLDIPETESAVGGIIDNTRRRYWAEGDKRALEVWSICGEIGKTLGYDLKWTG
ncbi:MAG: sulfotransferase [Rhodobacteraceae bacterium]|nr:sulfotransferase [Paracoccaceae bacterium]MCY4139675.1 sulfotransferase [Paracoccaceae bacterium]